MGAASVDGLCSIQLRILNVFHDWAKSVSVVEEQCRIVAEVVRRTLPVAAYKVGEIRVLTDHDELDRHCGYRDIHPGRSFNGVGARKISLGGDEPDVAVGVQKSVTLSVE